MLFTLNDIARFCYDNQKSRNKDGKIIKRSFDEWARIVVGVTEVGKLHSVESEDELVGVCIATIRPYSKVVYVHEIICVKNGFKTFIKEAFRRYPDFRIAGLRNKQQKTYTKDNLWAAIHHQ